MTNDPLLLGLPGILLSLVMILTRSDIVRRIASKIQGVPPMLPHEFDAFLLSFRGGWFIHKLWNCGLCQAFHISWISGIAVTSALLEFLPYLQRYPALLVYVTVVAHLFLACYAFLRGSVPASTTQVAAVEEEAEELPIPKIGFRGRLKTEPIEAGGVRILGMDPVAQRAFLVIEGKASCDGPRCQKVLDAWDAEKERLENDADCPECEKASVKNRYLDAMVAVYEED